MLIQYEPIYKTELGALFCADSLEFMRRLPNDSVDLVVTSPPYALHFKKEYGNASQREYIAWLLPFAREIKRIIKPTGSFVLNIGGAWQPGSPIRSLYHYRTLLALVDDIGFDLAQEFFWFNPAKMPAPAEWVNVRRIRVKDSVEYIFWLVKDPMANADNRRVLQPYSEDMKRLIKRGVKQTVRPSGHVINGSFASDKGGSIPSNLIQCGNNESNSSYITNSKQLGSRVHPARFPAELPRFFIEFLTNPGDSVLDPFAGSNTTGYVAEGLKRKWTGVEIRSDYAVESRLRFETPPEVKSSTQGQSLLPFDVVRQGGR
ncbi:MAG: site-specific DNA-methyltransferase [Nitrospiraceae bacterium]|uniref:DNA-methyltransferase n=1 Tax=Nitrospira cf. moscoviensis SBR1015 TaxID=96242 RepID=UPI000A0E9DB5|nr:site-specific DNA-methyltransferase [Nitrospira cf. moscoviensis SBR1015]MBY0246675.1 site-specific DNA-methyltransferase [Nitrospiraceae bacterium]OQW35320.1 MAG: DNA methyltransferase [Nitrospira sp. SG-bin2]